MKKLPQPISELQQILLPAYKPCACLPAPCATMRFTPVSGHVPRGFTGAFGSRQDVQLILVLAEPGDPAFREESYSSDVVLHASFVGRLAQLVRGALEQKISPFHKNLRTILDNFWPGLPLHDQLEKTWITESVLCSAQKTGGYIPVGIESACGENYLKRQIQLFPSAVIVALGGKAKRRLRHCGFIPHICAHAPGRPAGDKPAARKSWIEAGIQFREHVIYLHDSDSRRFPVSGKSAKLHSSTNGEIMRSAEEILSEWPSVEKITHQASGTIHVSLTGGISFYVNFRKKPYLHLLLHIRRLGTNHERWADQHADFVGGITRKADSHSACIELSLQTVSDLSSVLKKLDNLTA